MTAAARVSGRAIVTMASPAMDPRARRAGIRRPGFPGRFSLHPGHPADDVPRPALDDAAVRGLRDGRRIEPTLPVPSEPGRHRPECRLRPAHANGLRLGPPAGAGRSGTRRRGDRFDRGHGGALRRHPARSRLHVDDDQRDGDHPARALRRRRAAAGRRRCGALAARCRTTS